MGDSEHGSVSDSQAATQALAENVGAAMHANDRAVQGLGIRIERIAAGAATLTMTVRADMLNGFAICHGGFITVLADSAFAYACNSRNVMTVAGALAIDFLAPAHVGDVLTAEATEVSLGGRTGVYDVRVVNPRGACIAVMRGRSHAMKNRQTVPADRFPVAPAAR